MTLFSGTAAALVRGGVSAVAAMQYEISDPGAAGGTRRNSLAGRAGARAPQPPPTPVPVPPSHLARTLIGHAGGVWGAAFRPDGRLLATAIVDPTANDYGTARLWDPATVSRRDRRRPSTRAGGGSGPTCSS